MFNKYISVETKRRSKCYWYDELITKAAYLPLNDEEQKVIEKIKPTINKLNLKEYIMEIKELKGFAKEAGLSIKDIKGLSEDELILTIISAVDPEKNYSEDFTEWYDELDDEYFNKAEALDEDEDEEDDDAEKEGGDNELKEQLIEAIDDCKKMADLQEIIESEEFLDIFEDIDVADFKVASKLKKAMLEAVEEYYQLNDEEEEDEEEDEEGDEEGEEESDNTDLIKAIEKCKTISKLQKLAEDNDIFEGIKFKTGRGRGVKERDLEDVQEEMIALLNDEEEEEEVKEEKNTKQSKIDLSKSPIDFDVNDFDLDDVMDEVEALSFIKLKTFAKTIGLTVKPGVKQKDIITLIQDQLVKLSEEDTDEEEEEVVQEELNEELIQTAVETEDKELLLEICETLGIKTAPIQKKSVKQLGILALRQFKRKSKGSEKELEKEDKTIDKEERKSVYQLIEEMVLAEEDEDDIVEAVTPIFKERGKKTGYIKKRVASMIEIVKLDNDLD